MDFRRNNDNDELFDSNKYYNEKEIIDWYSNNNFPKDSEGDILHLPHIRIIPRWKEVDKFGEIYTPSYDEINFLFKSPIKESNIFSVDNGYDINKIYSLLSSNSLQDIQNKALDIARSKYKDYVNKPFEFDIEYPMLGKLLARNIPLNFKLDDNIIDAVKEPFSM